MGGHLDVAPANTRPAGALRRPPGTLPWPAGWARRTLGPQYRPAIAGGVACLIFAGATALTNPADGLLLAVFAVGMFVWALRPAPAYPIRVASGAASGHGAYVGVQFPMRISNPLDLLRRRPTVTLTPTAVVADHRRPVVIPWSEITEVRATKAQTGMPHALLPPPRQNWLTIGVADPSAVRSRTSGLSRMSRLARRFGANTATGFATTSVLSDPVVLYHALHYYLDNPHARHELAGPDAVHRIRAARVDPADS